DLGVEPDEDGEWDPEQGRERVHEDLDDVLCVTFDRGERFDVTLTLGGPNIHLVGFGAHGGAKIIGYWGERVEWSSPQVRGAGDYYWEAFADLAASDDWPCARSTHSVAPTAELHYGCHGPHGHDRHNTRETAP